MEQTKNDRENNQTQRSLQNKSWKDDLSKTRFVMNLWLLVGFVLVCAPRATGIALHEWLSVVFIVPLVIHLLLHWDWLKALPKKFVGKLSGESRFNAIWDALFYLAMLMVILSGFLVSEVIFPLLGIPLEILPVWSKIHHDLGNLLMPMLGIHLAMHWPWIKSMTKRMLTKKTNQIADGISSNEVVK
ncbi:cytochrome b/b6 domain-containing protein [Shewanella olleyana]|uniref:cytochrome b/b6 domain-containing protein n=1 Tax=Shewanella olleyana TaxID=135626 RepID=UPI00200D14A8|nr:cytochrome b/b6 domain-containing protein [Shewanella olleyana]MCL1065824.1 cytochrome b/b6 domain-containing protein [Shewanella olleyana]